MGQKVGSAVDGGLDFLLGDVNVEVEHKLQRDDGATERARGSHLVQPGNLAELALERRGDRRSHHVWTGAGIKGLNLNCWVIDLGRAETGNCR